MLLVRMFFAFVRLYRVLVFSPVSLEKSTHTLLAQRDSHVTESHVKVARGELWEGVSSALGSRAPRAADSVSLILSTA